jgi:3-phenylpropionate/trans-cinnamate dioxygenase ferredoxin subunit
MIRECPLSALPQGEALRVEAEPPIALVHIEGGDDVLLSHEAPSLPPGVWPGSTS